MATDKIKLRIGGNVFELPTKALRTNYKGNKEIYLNAKYTASLIKQYIKSLKLPISNWATSSVHSGGSSVDIYVCNPDGSEVSESVYKKIDKFADSFKAGSFDGMTDSYNYGSNGVTDNGTELNFSTLFIFVNNRPKWDTVEHVLRSISTGEPLETAVKYVSEGTRKKVLELYKK